LWTEKARLEEARTGVPGFREGQGHPPGMGHQRGQHENWRREKKGMDKRVRRNECGEDVYHQGVQMSVCMCEWDKIKKREDDNSGDGDDEWEWRMMPTMR
jgi:hypothetical protein